MNKIMSHYKKQATEWKESKQSTMKDINIRDMEMEKIIGCLKSLVESGDAGRRILEIGCGNGYVAERISNALGIEMVCMDYCDELVKIAQKRELRGVRFESGNALKLGYKDNSFDVVFTERCLINLESWEDQMMALNEIHRVLKRGGVYLMMEGFIDGLDNLNKAREAVALEPIPQPFHNIFFDKEKMAAYITNKYERYVPPGNDPAFENCEIFMSSYYYGSKVLYPAMVDGKKELIYNNKFIEYFRHLPPYGNYSYVQLLPLRKI